MNVTLIVGLFSACEIRGRGSTEGLCIQYLKILMQAICRQSLQMKGKIVGCHIQSFAKDGSGSCFKLPQSVPDAFFGSEDRNGYPSLKHQSNSVYPSLISLQTLLGGKQDFHGTVLTLIDPSKLFLCDSCGKYAGTETRSFFQNGTKIRCGYFPSRIKPYWEGSVDHSAAGAVLGSFCNHHDL